MTPFDIIKKKRDGGILTAEEIDLLIKGYVSGEVEDYQMSAFAMSVFFKGMTAEETANLTVSMMNSGDVADLSAFGELSADKHSTGGVGDKTTLIVAPIVASLGGIVAKMSGRGLGHTGGTVDKLEAIPGYRTELSPDEFRDIAAKVGVCVVGQTGNFVPADKKLYALRSVTATVDSLPLIASSIMSKKLASGSHSIVLDVKVGSGAFMKDYESAKQLADAMTDIGIKAGRRVAALITNMDMPLGCAVGNSLEVKEAVSVLKGEASGALREVCVALASKLLTLVHGWSAEEAAARVEESLSEGKAYAKFKEWIAAQGGDLARLPDAPVKVGITAPRDGYISKADSEEVGNASLLLGAGRIKKDDVIDPAAGIVMLKNVGDYVADGKPIAVFHTSDESKIPAAKERFLSALSFSEEKPKKEKLIY